MLLASSGEVVALGETVHLWERGVLKDERCSCGEPFSRCPFWSMVGDVAFGGWSRSLADEVLRLKHQVDRTRYVPLTLNAAPESRRGCAVERYAKFYVDIYRAVQEEVGGAWGLDSSKHVSLAAALAVAGGADLQILHVVRDPRAVAYSWSQTIGRPEAGHRAVMAKAHPARIAARWTTQNALFSLVRRRAPVYRVRYEDFAVNPADVLTRLRRLLDLPEVVDVTTSGDSWARFEMHSVSGNPMRFAAGPITVTIDNAWRSGLSTRDRYVVQALTAPLVHAYRAKDDS